MTDYKYAIYPAVGVARVGNKDGLGSGDFFLAPDEIGGLPKDCDQYGNETSGFSNFKDPSGKIKRQAQKFKVYQGDNEIIIGSTIDEGTVESIAWTVHLANKKSEWYGFSEQQGNLLYGRGNSYQVQMEAHPDPNDPEYVGLRNKDYAQDRHDLIIDPGPRTILGRNAATVSIDRQSTKDNLDNYPLGHFPPEQAKVGSSFQGRQINKLGDLKTDSEGRLLVLGGLGRSQGEVPLDSYGGADTWYDDISDGSVTCTIHLDGGETVEVEGKAWVIVGPPDFAPELVNISSWDDTTFDVGVRYNDLIPSMCEGGIYKEGDPNNGGFLVNYQRDILPIIKRIAGYQWVANVQSMSAFFANIFDFSDPSDINKPDRLKYFDYFRKPEPQVPNNQSTAPSSYPSVQYEVFADGDSIPLMPLNSGSNSVSNYNIKKFMALTQTQYFLLKQWANGYFESTPNSTPSYPGVNPGAHQRNRASVGNVVGLPQCPGIEVTWTTQNPAIYDENDSYRIKHADSYGYSTNGLTPGRDECETEDGTVGGVSSGCEPGDLTKRMAIPWQADFFNCTIQLVNFSDSNENKRQKTDDNGDPMFNDNDDPIMEPTPPTYYSYWWPPQAPWDVLGGDNTAADQDLSGISAGLQINFMRGINSYGQMVNDGWSYLAFIRNQNANEANYSYFVETERDHEMFNHEDVPISSITNRDDDEETSIKVFFLKDLPQQKEKRASRMQALNLEIEEELLVEIQIAASHRRRAPRSGTRVRF